MLFKNTLIATLLLSSFGCVTHDQRKGERRPFRLGMTKFDSSLDYQKPLAPGDYSGWVERSGLFIGSTRAHPGSDHLQDLLALNFKNGTELWRKPLTGLDLSVPVHPLHNGIVVAQLDGSISKLDLQTGQLLWQISLPTFINVRMTSESGQLFVVTASQVLYALNSHDGKIEWVYDPDMPKNEIRIHNTAAPLVSGSHLYWGLSSGEIVGLELQSGQKKWRQNPKIAGGGRFHNYMGSMLVYKEHLVFCRYDGLIGAVSLENKREGELLWQVEGNTGNCADSDSRSGRFYAVTTSGDALAVNAETGNALWTGVKLGTGLSTVTAAEDSILITGTEGHIYALNTSGALEWYDNVDARLLSRPILLGKTAHFASGLKNIYSYQF